MATVARRVQARYLGRMAPIPLAPGAALMPGYLDRDAQLKLLADVEAVLRAAPLYTRSAGNYHHAVYDAVGVRIQDVPITAEKALGARRS